MTPFTLLLTITLTISPPDYVAFGDSITAGLSATDYQHSFIGLLENDIGQIDNQAVVGTSIGNHYQEIISYTGNAKNVIWLSGYNDMRLLDSPPEAYREMLIQSLNVLRARGATVYLGECLRMTPSGYLYSPNGSEDRVNELRQVQIEVSRLYTNVVFVPMNGYDPNNKSDLVHPDNAGHYQIYQAFLRYIRPIVYLPIVIK